MLDFDIRLIQLVLKISVNFDHQSHIDGLQPKLAFEILLSFRLESNLVKLVLKILITDLRQFRVIKY